jgi:hypothetical protein
MRSAIKRVGKGLMYRCYVLYKEKQNTRWFKYDRDLCGLFTHKSVPVIFEPPCTYLNIIIYSQTFSCYFKLEQSVLKKSDCVACICIARFVFHDREIVADMGLYLVFSAT